jgi:uncharacterized protein with von Willebrand factor type A (vWA) domain
MDKVIDYNQIDSAFNDIEWLQDEDGELVLDTDSLDEIQDEFIEHMDKLNSVGVVYERADSILTAQNISVQVVSDKAMDCTAMNDGKNITFNANLINELTDETIVALHGFNYHEVAHILYTPRENSELGKYVLQNKLHRAMNILEDSRIEALITAKYPSTKPFLEAGMTDLISRGTPAEWGDYFILTTGRKYLDLEIRQDIANRFVNKHGIALAEEIFAITHAYRELVFPTDTDKAKELLLRFGQIVGYDEEQPKFNEPKSGHNNRDLMDSGRMKSAKEQSETQDKVSEEASEDLNGVAKSDTANKDDIQDNSNNPTEDEKLDQELADKLNKRISEIIKDEEVKRDTAEIRKAIYENDMIKSGLKQSSYQDMDTTPDMRRVADQFGRELERIRIENDPAWNIEQPSGRLNVQRAMHADINDIDKIFDRWELGNDSNDIEAVILLDHSGSMSRLMTATVQSAWTIKKGIEMIDGRVTVFKFNHASRLLYSADDKVIPSKYRYVGASGTTNPIHSLIEAERILNSSTRGVKILFVVTDGQWENEDLNNACIQRIKDTGAITSVVFIGDLEYNSDYSTREYYDKIIAGYQHGADTFRAIGNPNDLVDVASDLVQSALTRSRY